MRQDLIYYVQRGDTNSERIAQELETLAETRFENTFLSHLLFFLLSFSFSGIHFRLDIMLVEVSRQKGLFDCYFL